MKNNQKNAEFWIENKFDVYTSNVCNNNTH